MYDLFKGLQAAGDLEEKLWPKPCPPTGREGPRGRVVSLLASSQIGACPPDAIKPKPCAVIFSLKNGVVPKRDVSRVMLNAEVPRQGGCDAPAVIHRVLHPQGFRILNDRSVIERSLRGYFRLPPAPSGHLQLERQRIHNTFRRLIEDERTANKKSEGEEAVLDGFLLLTASCTEDPVAVEAVTLQCANLTSSIPEDLRFFVNLFFLDVSENHLRLEDVLALNALETLHMACNGITSLEGIKWALLPQHDPRTPSYEHEEEDCTPSFSLASTRSSTHDVLLTNLRSLNLSFNRIPISHIPLLAHFPCLEKLDLSGNDLRMLPRDLSCLTGVTHLALESNQFHTASAGEDAVDVFQCLSTMPSLVEVNLNRNQLSWVPVLHVQDGRGLCFPSIEIIGISDNRFKSPESVAELGKLHRTLRRVVLANNPICAAPTGGKRVREIFADMAAAAFYRRKEKSQRWGEEGAGASFTRAAHTSESSSATEGSGKGGRWGSPEWTRLIPRRDKDIPDSLQDAARAAAVAAAASSPIFSPSAASQQSDKVKCVPTVFSCGMLDDSGVDFNAVLSHRDEDDDDGVFLPKSQSAFLVNQPIMEPATTTQFNTSFASVENYMQAYRVEIVMQETVMPKQSLRQFYACRAWDAAWRSTLVTIPQYNEFMDIFQLTRARGRGSRRKPNPLHASAKSTDHTLVSSLTHSTPGDKTVGKRESDEDVALPADASAVRPKSREASQEKVVFFMTEMEEDSSPGSAGLSPGVVKSEDVSATAAGAPQDQETVTPIPHSVSTLKKTKMKTKLPEVSSTAHPVVTTSVNVHTALNELRDILRKPLPPLPYAKKNQKPL